jgi:HEAT repeat protein
VLIAYMQSPHYFARWKAVIAAGTARSDATKSMLEPHIINLLTDRVYIVRMYAADSLEMIGDTSAIPHLEPLLDDRWEVADVVKKAIFKLSHPEENAPKNH